MVDWKEREHDNINTQTMVDPNCLNSLRNCGLLKFFLTLGLRAPPELLRYLISLWDVNQEFFMIRDQELELETSDIYFIIGLSQIGDPVNLYGSRPIGASVTMLLVEHYLEALKLKSDKIEIMTVRDLVLRVLLLTITKVAGAQAQHETNKSKFQYVIDCMSPTIFN